MKEKIISLFTDISKHEHFLNVNSDVAKAFYHIFIRTKRNFLAIEKLLNNTDLPSSFLEAMPLLRIIMESYIHLCYLVENDPSKVKESYEALSKYESTRIAQKLSYMSGMHESEQDFIDSVDLEYKLPKEFDFLGDMQKLARHTDNLVLYRKYYGVFSSYVHFNPSTYSNYGEFIGDRFLFNFKNSDQEGSQEFNDLYVRIVTMFLAKVVIFINIMPRPQKLNELCEAILTEK